MEDPKTSSPKVIILGDDLSSEVLRDLLKDRNEYKQLEILTSAKLRETLMTALYEEGIRRGDILVHTNDTILPSLNSPVELEYTMCKRYPEIATPYRNHKEDRMYEQVMDYMNAKLSFDDLFKEIQEKRCKLPRAIREYVVMMYERDVLHK